MSDYEYILKQARKFHYSKWTDEELRKCVDMLPNLSREELTTLIMSKWTRDAKILRESIFNILFKDQIGKREERIKNFERVEMCHSAELNYVSAIRLVEICRRLRKHSIAQGKRIRLG